VEREQGSGSGWGSSPHITPEDVQSREFGSARLRVGYVMHEVDEFLDQVTDTLAALLAENERLRAERGAAPASPSPVITAPPSGADERAAVEAFLQREKSFLQDLGVLVQTHAEELKSMVRSARASAPASSQPGSAPAEAAPATTPAPAAHDAPGPAATTPVVAATPEPVAAAQPQTAPSTPQAPPGPDGSESAPAAADEEAPPGETRGDEDVDAILGGSTSTAAFAPVEVEEPIRVEEPEPARSRRSDEAADSSLRELFWGEE
jgi:DivIVA domain-containing protein